MFLYELKHFSHKKGLKREKTPYCKNFLKKWGNFLQQTLPAPPPPRRIVTFKLLKGCHLGVWNNKSDNPGGGGDFAVEFCKRLDLFRDSYS